MPCSSRPSCRKELRSSLSASKSLPQPLNIVVSSVRAT